MLSLSPSQGLYRRRRRKIWHGKTRWRVSGDSRSEVERVNYSIASPPSARVLRSPERERVPRSKRRALERLRFCILSSSWRFIICLAMFGGWFTSPSTNDSNFLRVANTFTSRRLSDNTLMTPKIRIAPSCASSPGGTPGGGLPIRRHSSTGPQERRGSNINLSPPTVHISQMPISRSDF